MGLGSTTSAGKTNILLHEQSWVLVSVRVSLSISPNPSVPWPA